MSDKSQLPLGAGKIKSSTSLPTSTSASASTTGSDGLASHIRLSNIFAPLIDLNASGEQIATDYDSTTLHSLQSTMSSSSSSNPVSVIAKAQTKTNANKTCKRKQKKVCFSKKKMEKKQDSHFAPFER